MTEPGLILVTGAGGGAGGVGGKVVALLRQRGQAGRLTGSVAGRAQGSGGMNQEVAQADADRQGAVADGGPLAAGRERGPRPSDRHFTG